MELVVRVKTYTAGALEGAEAKPCSTQPAPRLSDMLDQTSLGFSFVMDTKEMHDGTFQSLPTAPQSTPDP